MTAETARQRGEAKAKPHYIKLLINKNMNKTEQVINTFDGFRKGLGQIKVKDYKTVVEELWKALGINNRNSFYGYRDGKIALKAVQAEAVKQVFVRHGVLTDIWGE